MIRPTFLLSALALLAAPAAATNYSAKLAAPANVRIIANDIIWTCGPDACQGATDESRPVVICQSLARQAGRVGSFLADGRAFSDAELAKCNASAKAPSAKTLAAQ